MHVFCTEEEYGGINHLYGLKVVANPCPVFCCAKGVLVGVGTHQVDI